MLHQTALFHQTTTRPQYLSLFSSKNQRSEEISLSDSFTFSYQSINAEITNDTGLFWRGDQLIAIEGL